MKKVFIVLLIFAVYALHQDFWNWRSTYPLVFGFLPVGLAYHAAYSILASILMAVLVKLAWPKDLDAVEPQDPPVRPKSPGGHA